VTDTPPLESAGPREREAWVLIGALPGLSLRRKLALARRRGPIAAAAIRPEEVTELAGPDAAVKVETYRRAVTASRLLEDAARAGGHVITLADPTYPALLRAIADPPPALYVRGSIPAADAVAVVGTRRASVEGEEVAHALAGGLAAAGVCVVSGLARGIDGAAHRGALDADGATVGVLACGLDRPYPADHRDLIERIAERGAIVTEHPVGMPPLAHHFPIRNRIISGLARATVVVEAPLSSGAMITADLALEQGRDVFAVPGSPLNPRSRGPHRLLREGAHVTEGAPDILRALGLETATAGTDAGASAALLALLREPLHPDEVVLRAGGRDPSTVLAALTALELQGLVRRVAGGRYLRSAR
jgi:DNA processing protein